MLADGRGVVANHQFYLAARSYAAKNPQVLQAIIDELTQLDRWAESNAKKVSALLAPQIGLDLATTELATGRFSYGIKPVTPAIAAEQQKIADVFFGLKLIPKAIKVSGALAKPLRATARRLIASANICAWRAASCPIADQPALSAGLFRRVVRRGA